MWKVQLLVNKQLHVKVFSPNENLSGASFRFALSLSISGTAPATLEAFATLAIRVGLGCPPIERDGRASNSSAASLKIQQTAEQSRWQG
jgi:hypothetical protein